MIRIFSIAIFLLIGLNAGLLNAQTAKNVLFLGNSYTAVNNLPELVRSLAASAGDQLSTSSNTPGGYTFQQHLSNSTSTSLIQQGGWDYVVLQEQSQYPSFPDNQVESEVFPYAEGLVNMVKEYNPCGEAVFYMTWGRKNGDAGNCAVWPPVCTYEGMDSLLHLRYMMMAENNDAVCSPVGAVWHQLRTQYPSIELYSSDESHPSMLGSYAAACCFYTTIFQKDPTLITSNYGLDAQDAQNIRNVVKSVVFDSLSHWFIGAYEPKAEYTYLAIQPAEIQFTNASLYAETFDWNFGDGSTATDENPIHIYQTGGFYDVKLTVRKCQEIDSISKTLEIIVVGIEEEIEGIRIYPNPIQENFQIESSESFNYMVFTADGRLVKSGKHQSGASLIEMSQQSKGIYYLEILYPEKRILKKLIKQ